ncbi:MAG: DUF1080 domain-containing protein [Gemmataceae bacterium]
MSRPVLTIPRLALLVVTMTLAGVSFAADAKKPAASEWKTLFDGKTLKGWKASDFFGPGKVEVKDGAIVLHKGMQMTGVIYSGGDFPKTDYEVTLEAKKVEGDDFFATTTFPVGDSFCSFVVGGWGGQVIGLSTVDSADASMNETTKSKEFKAGQWYRIRVRVTKHRIETWIDKEQIVDLDTTDRTISVRVECRLCRPFGVATYDTVGAIRDIRVRALTEAEKKAAAAKKKDD